MFCSNCGTGHQPEAKFCSACGSRLGAPASPPPSAPAAPERPAPSAGPSTFKILDAGDKLLLSGDNAAEVEAALQGYLKDGAKLVTSLCQVGRAWTAACTIPPTKKNLDDTQSLSLAEMKVAITQAIDERDDGCRVEVLGFKRLVYGPSALSVKLRIDHMRQYGAQLIGEIEEDNGEWVAVCDVGSAKDTGFRW